MIRAIIIDDIQKAIDTLNEDLRIYCPQVTVVGTANGVVEGAKLIKKEKPDLLLLDIQMNDGSGFDLLDLIDTKTLKIIFVTAHDEHAHRAFKYAAQDYLLKPVDPDELKIAIEKIEQQVIDRKPALEVLKEHLSEHKKSNRIVLNTQEKMYVVDCNEIIACESEGNYTRIFLSNSKKILVSNPLNHYEKLLSEQNFYRVHHSFLANMLQVNEFSKSDSELLMKDGTRIPVSDRRRKEVMHYLEDI